MKLILLVDTKISACELAPDFREALVRLEEIDTTTSPDPPSPLLDKTLEVPRISQT